MNRNFKKIIVLSMIIQTNIAFTAQVDQFKRPVKATPLQNYPVVSSTQSNVFLQNPVGTTPDYQTPYHLQPVNPEPLVQHIRSKQSDNGSLKAEKQTLVTTRYRQRYHNIPILGHQIIVHNRNGHQTMTGTLVKGIEQDINQLTPDLSKNEAYEKTMQYFKKTHPKASINYQANQVPQGGIKKVIYIDPNTDQAYLAYQIKISAYDATRPYFQMMVINANTGKVFKSYNMIAFNHGFDHQPAGTSFDAFTGQSNQRDNDYSFTSNPSQSFEYGPLVVQRNNSECQLDNGIVRNYDLNNRTFSEIVQDYNLTTFGSAPLFSTQEIMDGLNVYQFNCNNGLNDSVSGDGQTAFSPLSDSYQWVTKTVDLLKNQYDYSGSWPAPIEAFTHVKADSAYVLPRKGFFNGQAYPVQIWIGTNPTDGRYVTFASASVVSHEVGHIVTGQNSRLNNYGQAGAINESFSDITAMALYDQLQKQYDWSTYHFVVGGTITLQDPFFIRSLKNPPADHQSIENASNYQPGMGIHHAAGVYNKAFYELVQQPGWNVAKAYQLFLQANLSQWTPTTNFNTGLCGLLNAAYQLGDSPTTVAKVFADRGVYCDGHSSDDKNDDTIGFALGVGGGFSFLMLLLLFL